MLFSKSIILSAALLLGLLEPNIKSPEGFWQTDYQQAVTRAKKENKSIMLYFSGSDWCKPCIIWKKEVFDTETFQHYAEDRLVTVKLDFPRLKKNRLPEEQVKQNEELAKRYNPEGVFPMIVFIDKNGKVIDKSAYRAGGPEEFIKYTENILTKNN